MYKETIINLETNETSERAYTKAEIDAVEASKKEIETEVAKRQADAEAKAIARAAILDRLGLTAEEAAALLG